MAKGLTKKKKDSTVFTEDETDLPNRFRRRKGDTLKDS